MHTAYRSGSRAGSRRSLSRLISLAKAGNFSQLIIISKISSLANLVYICKLLSQQPNDEASVPAREKMGSKRKHRSRERSRSRDRLKVKRERRSRSRSSESGSRRRRRTPSPCSAASSLKTMANRHQQVDYSQPIEDFDREYFFRMSKRIQEDFKEEVDKGSKLDFRT